MNNIKKTSLYFRILFQVLFAALPIVLIMAWFQSDGTLRIIQSIVNISYIPAAYSGKIMHTLSMSDKFLAMGAGILPLLVREYILFALIQLFKLYEREIIFSNNNVRYLRNIGFALIATQAIDLIYQGLMGFVLTWKNPPGLRFSAISLDQTNIGIVLVGVMVVLVSWIMLEGSKIREEQQLTV